MVNFSKMNKQFRTEGVIVFGGMYLMKKYFKIMDHKYGEHKNREIENNVQN